jgi:hypothetical protein
LTFGILGSKIPNPHDHNKLLDCMITIRLGTAGCRLRNGALDEHSSGQPTSGAVVAFSCRLKKNIALGSILQC